MMKPIPKTLLVEKNRQVLEYLEPLSCHGDIVEPLDKALSGLPDCNSFCPDNRNFRYCLWYLNDVVFAFAVGMQKVWLNSRPAILRWRQRRR